MSAFVDRQQSPSISGAETNPGFLYSHYSAISVPDIHSGYNRDHEGTTEPERSRNVKLKRTCHPVFVLDLTHNDLLELHGPV